MTVETRLKELEDTLRLLRGPRFANADQFQGRRVSSKDPGDADVYSWDNTAKKWEPEAPSTAVAHTLDSTHHSDVATMTEVRGDMILRNASSNWDRLAVGSANSALGSDGTDVTWSTSLSLAGTLTVDTINEITGAAGVTIEGVLLKDNDVVAGSGDIYAQSGSAAAPSLSFASDSTTGFFRQAASVIGFTLGGSERWRMGGNVLQANSSSQSIKVDTINERTGGGGVTVDTAQIKDNGIVFIEAADHPITPAATKGQLWVKTASPNELWFTDDGGADTQLGVGGGGNTLDAAYDQGGAGSGRTITADSGVVDITDDGLQTTLLDVTTRMVIDSTIDVQYKLLIQESATINDNWNGIGVNPTFSLEGNNHTIAGVDGSAVIKPDGGTTGTVVKGLRFLAKIDAADLANAETATAVELTGAHILTQVVNNQLAAPAGDRTIDVTTARGVWIAPAILYLGVRATGSVSTMIGVDIEDPNSDHVVDYTAIQIDAETAATGTIIGIRQNGVAMENRFESNLNTFGKDAVATATIHAIQDSTSGAKPVARLQQDDIDDSFIDFVGTSAADGTRSISSDTTEDSAKFGAVRVEINGTTKWVRIYDDES